MNQDFFGEQLVFKMNYLNLSVATLQFQIIDTVQNSYHLKIHARASRTARLLFKLDNVYETFFDRTTFLPGRAIKKIHQKNIQHDLTINYDQQQNRASIGDSISWFIPADCYDYFSLLYLLRSRELNAGDSLHYHLDSEFLISQVAVKVLPEREVIQVPAGKFESIKLAVKFSAVSHQPRPWKTDLLTNRLAKPGSRLLIWFSNDQKRLPLKISYQQSALKTHIVLKSYHRGKQN